MNELEKIRTWNALKSVLGKITDYKARTTFYKAFLARACSEWGFNPERPGKQVSTQDVELDDWEKEFVEDIHDSIVFGFDVRAKKRKQTYSECYAKMTEFVRNGGLWSDIPESIRCESLKKMYNDCRDTEHTELMALADYAINL